MKINRSKRSQQDPTGQARNRRKGTAALDRRLTLAERRIITLFRAIPRTRASRAKVRNAAESTVFYDYDIDANERLILATDVELILNDELLETQGDQPAIGWYWEPMVAAPYAQGTGEEVVTFNALVAGAIAAGTLSRQFVTPPSIEQVLLSREYRQRLASVVVRNFDSIKTLSQRTASQINTDIGLEIDSGSKPSEVVAAIRKRIEVAKSGGSRTAATEINRAYNDGKIEQAGAAARETGLKSGVIHISALLSTTRPHHAARHGNAYTLIDQQQWWNRDANRINCHCTVRSVLVGSDGRVIDIELQETIKAERSFFD